VAKEGEIGLVGMYRARGVVVEGRLLPSGAQELVVDIAGARARAINYPELTGWVAPGVVVDLNTTAVELGLGTGGYHFVLAAMGAQATVRGSSEGYTPSEGHIMKLRYTPHQVRCLAVEEEDSPYHELLRGADDLAGMPVVAAELHSMVAPVAAGIKVAAGDDVRVAYIMTDAAALPLAFSRTVPELKAKGLIIATITAGQAFGGDYEAVNLYSALLAAKWVVKADVSIVAMGPGTVGTGTQFGCSAVEQGQTINAALSLGGKPIAVLRLSERDLRPRHKGVSHHTLTALTRVALGRATAVLPELTDQAFLRVVKHQLDESGVSTRHDIVTASGCEGLDLLARLNLRVTSMGRGPEEDPAFFLAAAAAGRVAAGLVSGDGV
jgi:hypothetical protein